MDNSLLDEIRRIIRLQLGVRVVEETDLLVEDLGAESADIANIVAALEARFNVQISESEMAKIRSVADLEALFYQGN